MKELELLIKIKIRRFSGCACVRYLGCQTVYMLVHYLWQQCCWYNLSPWKGPIIPDYKSYQKSRLDIWVIQLNPLHSSWTLLGFMSIEVAGSDPPRSSEFKLILFHIICSWILETNLIHFQQLPKQAVSFFEPKRISSCPMTHWLLVKPWNEEAWFWFVCCIWNVAHKLILIKNCANHFCLRIQIQNEKSFVVH